MSDWKQEWVEVSKHDSGGQASTIIVKRKIADDHNLYILKLLTRQKDLERRKRMCREYFILKTLDDPGIPKAIISNANNYEKLEEKLFIVMEYVDGITLENYVENNNKINILDCIEMMLSLLLSLKNCHENNVTHRDIKPDNIILRNSNIHHPVIVDFGQSFNENDDIQMNTPDSEIMGNRFLSLPELSVFSGSKRDKRSDITMCCGVFFYCLTGSIPRVLSDHAGKMPHQRNKIIIDVSNKNANAIINRIFDTAFQPLLDNRYPNADSLTSDINELKNSLNVISENKEASLNTFLDNRKTPEFNRRRGLISIVETIANFVRQAQRSAKLKLGEDFSIAEGKLIKDFSRYIGGKTFMLHDQVMNFSASFMVCGLITGDEIVILGKLIDHPLNDSIDYRDGKQITRVLINEIDDIQPIILEIEKYIISEYIGIANQDI
jgi:serine/threonine protein kinase